MYTPAKDLADQFEVSEIPDVQPHYNIAPTQEVIIVRVLAESSRRELVKVRWGLVPHWAKDDKMAAGMINARCETVAEKPAFRAAFKYRRCLIPTNGFYEWKKEKSRKQPFLFEMADHNPFAFGGVWEHWKSPEGAIVDTCSIITTGSNDLLKEIHDRMPLIIRASDYGLWLDPQIRGSDALTKLFEPFPPGLMTVHPVTPKVNSPSYDSPDCVDPLKIRSKVP